MYYTIENSRDECLDRASSFNEAIEKCNTINNAKEVFEYTDEDELVGCVYKK